MRTRNHLSLARTITAAALIAALAAVAGGQSQSPPTKQAAMVEQPASPVIETVWSVAAQRDGRAGLIVDVVVTSPGNSEFSLQLFDAEHEPLRSGGANEQLPAFLGRVLDGKPETHVEFFTPFDAASPAIEPGERLIARITARGKQGASSAEAIITVPKEGRAPPEALLRFAGVRQESGQIAPQTLDVGGVGRDIRNPEPSPNGTRALLAVEAQGLRRRAMTTTVWTAMVGEMVTTTAFRSQFGYENARQIGQHEQPVNANTARFDAIDYFVRDSDRKPITGEGEFASLACLARCSPLEATWDAPLAEKKGWSLRTPDGQEIKLHFAGDDEPAASDEQKQTAGVRQPSQPDSDEDIPATANSTPNSALLSAASEWQAQKVRALLNAGADVRTRGALGRTPLHLAAANGHKAVVEMLVVAQPPPDPDNAPPKPPQRTQEGDSASLFGREITPEYLDSISFDTYADTTRANANMTDDGGMTALHLAALGGHYDVASLLVAHQSDVNAADRNGLTSLHAAALAGDDAIVALLLNAGADPTVRDKDGDTPLAVAASKSVKRRLKEASSKTAGDPQTNAARAVVEAYLEAARAGDSDAARRVVTTEMAREMGEGLVAPPGQAAKTRYEMRKVTAEGREASAEVWMKNLKRPGDSSEALLTFSLRREADRWLIYAMDVEPYFRELDAEEDAE